VQAQDEIHIALTSDKSLENPMVEIIIGGENNTISVIRIDQEANVVTMPTLGVLNDDGLSRFRVTWTHNVITVSRDDGLPFIGFSLREFFDVNYFGLRTVVGRASWSVRPIGF
jgi:hypothetical protein